MRTYLRAALLTIPLITLFFILSAPISTLESGALDSKFLLRGERPIDSNIVVIYLDNADIASLGGWPLKRSYYALLLNALNDLGAKAVGTDIFFEDPNRIYPEFDSLLTSVVSNCGNVVLPSYAERVGMGETASPVDTSRLVSFTYPLTNDSDLLVVGKYHLPFSPVVEAAAGVGHANLPENATVHTLPLFFRLGDRAFPSLAFEMARVYRSVRREDVRIENKAAALISRDGTVKIPISGHGALMLNYGGGISSFKKYRFIDFLRSYDAMKENVPSQTPLPNVKGKAVLIGVIAAGYGRFVGTPFSENFPGVGIHATALDNLITGNFLTVPSSGLNHFLSAILGFTVFLIVVKLRGGLGVVVVLAILILYSVLNLLMFSFSSISLPIAEPAAAMMLMTVAGLVFGHQTVRSALTRVEADRESVLRNLMEKEKKLMELESELRKARQMSRQKNEGTLREEIQKYREDIRALATQAGDLAVYAAPASDSEDTCEVFEGLVYSRSGKMHRIVDLVKKVAPSDANVFIFGESGTGKELIARAIHQRSNRREKAFVAVNCGALTESLLESELFGHERGAFTGAVKEKAGRFEMADGGTIFLDEITETAEAFQVKLLRVLQAGEFERVGGTSTMRVNVRVVAASNKNINALIEEKRFREDLYYRLSVFTIELPPLRERKADIPFLIDHFIQREGDDLKLSTAVADALVNYDWKGNVRELESVIKRSSILARAEGRNLIRIKDLPEEVAASLQKFGDLEERILLSLREKGFSRSAISETAEELGGLNRGTVAEYFRGLCFKVYCEQQFDFSQSVAQIAATNDPEVVERVTKKVREYLSNVVGSIDTSKTSSEAKSSMGAKYKNLPQRYHFFLDQIIESYCQHQWKLPDE
jgi:transcriptional regulator with GAF, ATPase, and Fis domain/CHASE2 domain-containing sensor protein